MWRSLVARYLGVVEAAGSNPVTQTRQGLEPNALQAFFILVKCTRDEADIFFSPRGQKRHQPDTTDIMMSVFFLFLSKGDILCVYIMSVKNLILKYSNHVYPNVRISIKILDWYGH